MRKSISKVPWIICSVFLFIITIFAAYFNESFDYLLILGSLALIFGSFYLLSSMRKPMGVIISVIVIIVLAAICYLFINFGKELLNLINIEAILMH